MFNSKMIGANAPASEPLPPLPVQSYGKFLLPTGAGNLYNPTNGIINTNLSGEVNPGFHGGLNYYYAGKYDNDLRYTFRPSATITSTWFVTPYSASYNSGNGYFRYQPAFQRLYFGLSLASPHFTICWIDEAGVLRKNRILNLGGANTTYKYVGSVDYKYVYITTPTNLYLIKHSDLTGDDSEITTGFYAPFKWSTTPEGRYAIDWDTPRWSAIDNSSPRNLLSSSTGIYDDYTSTPWTSSPCLVSWQTYCGPVGGGYFFGFCDRNLVYKTSESSNSWSFTGFSKPSLEGGYAICYDYETSKYTMWGNMSGTYGRIWTSSTGTGGYTQLGGNVNTYIVSSLLCNTR